MFYTNDMSSLLLLRDTFHAFCDDDVGGDVEVLNDSQYKVDY